MARMPFSNETMRQPCKGKPHIVFINGLWRVSPERKRDRFKYPGRWSDAHWFIQRLNEPLLVERFKPKPYRHAYKGKPL